jgi:hypothetical protein
MSIPDYPEVIERLREAVASVLPPAAKVLVISKGDDNLLRLDARPAAHFPQSPQGGYAGYYPADSAAAIAHLERLRDDGAEALVIPSPSLWWLSYYGEFGSYLHHQSRLLWQQNETGAIFALCSPAIDPDFCYYVKQLQSLMRHLLPEQARVAVIGLDDSAREAWAGFRVELLPGAEVEQLPARGFEYLLLGKGVSSESLGATYRCMARQQHLGAIYELQFPPGPGCIS